MESGLPSVLSRSQFSTESHKMAGLFLERVKEVFGDLENLVVTSYSTEEVSYSKGEMRERVTIRDTRTKAQLIVTIHTPGVDGTICPF